MQKVKFSINQPVDLILQSGEGHRVPSDYGDGFQYQFKTTDQRLVYVSPSVGDQIHALKLKPGGAVRITKTERAGGARGFDWTVERLGEQPDGTLKIPKAEPVPVPGFAASASSSSPSTVAVQHITEPSAIHPVSEVEAHCYRLIDLMAAGNQYATERYGGAVSPEDVRSSVITSYIQAGKMGLLRRRPVARVGVAAASVRRAG